MRPSHLNLSVPDVPAASTFFRRYFGFTERTTTGHALAVLGDGAGFILVVSRLIHAGPEGQAGSAPYPRDFHIGFELDHTEEVDDLYRRFQADGLEPGRPPVRLRGAYTFYLMALETLMIEVTAR